MKSLYSVQSIVISNSTESIQEEYKLGINLFGRYGTSKITSGWMVLSRRKIYLDRWQKCLPNIIADDTDSNLNLTIRATPYLRKGALENNGSIFQPMTIPWVNGSL